MIDRSHDLPITRQAKVLNVSRGSVYYRPRPASAADLALMRRMDELHLDFPFAGSRMLRDLLTAEGFQVGRRHVATLMKRMGIQAVYRKPNTSKPAPGNKIYPYLLRDLPVTRPNQVWAMDITYIPMARGFVYLAAVIDWFSRRVLAWRLSITMEAGFCVEAVEEALARHGKPEIFNTDQGSQFTSTVFTGLLTGNAIAISMDGRGAWRDNVFVERLWRSVKHEEVYLRAYDTVAEARASIGRYLSFYDCSSQRTSLYVADGNRFSWAGSDAAGCLGLLRARRTKPRAAGPSRSARLKIQGPFPSGCEASISPRSAAIRNVRGATPTSAAARRRLSHGSMPSAAAAWTGILWCERSEVTRSRVHRLPLPVVRPSRVRKPAMASSFMIRARPRTASTTSAGVALRCPRRRRGSRCSVWAPPAQCSTRTISAAASSRSAMASWITVRTMRFLSRASVVGADQTARRSSARAASRTPSRSCRGEAAASCAARRASTSATRARARSQRASSSPATRRFSGSAASYWRDARSAA